MTNKKVIILSGTSGSGKSTLASKLAKENNGIICSTDNFFMVNGEYKFDIKFISEAHQWCYGQFCLEIFLGQQYIILDNTNLEDWNLFKYCETLFKFGYDFEIIEPKTKWRYDPVQCSLKNSHGVPQSTIEKMLAKKQDIKEMDKELRKKFQPK